MLYPLSYEGRTPMLPRPAPGHATGFGPITQATVRTSRAAVTARTAAVVPGSRWASDRNSTPDTISIATIGEVIGQLGRTGSSAGAAG